VEGPCKHARPQQIWRRGSRSATEEEDEGRGAPNTTMSRRRRRSGWRTATGEEAGTPTLAPAERRERENSQIARAGAFTTTPSRAGQVTKASGANEGRRRGEEHERG